MRGYIVFPNKKIRKVVKRDIKICLGKYSKVKKYKMEIKCSKYNSKPENNQYKIGELSGNRNLKTFTETEELKGCKSSKCYKKHLFGDYSRDYISEQEFQLLYVKSEFINGCSGCNTYFFRENQFTFGKDYPKDKVKVGRYSIYRDDRLIGTKEQEEKSKEIVRQIKNFRKFYKMRNIKKKEKMIKKKCFYYTRLYMFL